MSRACTMHEIDEESMLKEMVWGCGLDSSCEYSNEPLGCIKSGEFLDYLIFNKDPIPWS